MGSRPAVHIVRKAGSSGITVDFRALAPHDTPLAAILEEVEATYLDLVGEAKERWKDAVENEALPDGYGGSGYDLGSSGYSSAY